MKKLSVVVPIYNSEKYLDRCVQSIIQQSYENLEIILVNDGSTDNSKKICDKYIKLDSRVIVIDKSNSGVSAARNVGIRFATGQYLTFVDSDDWIERDMYAKMIHQLESNHVDFCLCNVFEDCEGKTSVKHDLESNLKVEKRDYFIDRIYVKEDITFNLWNMVVKRANVEDILLNENIWMSEDNLYILQMLLRIDSGVFMNESFYHYVQYQNSLSHAEQFTYKTFSRVWAIEKQAEILKQNKKEVYKKYRHVLLRDYVNTCRRMASSGCKEKNGYGV